jgi:osmotically-inducible protein OsmY
LQSQIEGALRNDPSLSSSQVSVRVSGDTIEISGSVPTGIEKLTAERLARSFAGDRKVDDKLMVAGQPAGAGSSNPVSQR